MSESARMLLLEVENDYRYHHSDVVEVFGIYSAESSDQDVPNP